MSPKILLSIPRLLLITLIASNLHADLKKGQKAYVKNCKVCHGNSTKGASMHTQEEWEELFANSGEKIIKLHANNEKSADFFNTDNFKNQYRELRDFLFAYASD